MKLDINNLQFKKVLDEAFKLRIKKYECYGDTYKEFGLIGLVIKINDKCGRLKNIIKNPKLNDSFKDDSLRDTAIDLLNYSAMFVMTLDEEKRLKNVNKRT